MPKSLIYKFESERMGCYRVKFVGNFLFAACSTAKYTCIKVFALENGEKVMTLKGHRDIIYSMASTLNEKYLVTSGSDHIVKVWQIPESSAE